MKKLLAMLLTLMLALCAASALAAPGEADITMNETQYHLTLDSVEIKDGKLYIAIGGLAETLDFGANGLRLAANAVPCYGGEALHAEDKDILFGTEVTFRFDRDTLPDAILLEPTEEGQESVLLWKNDETRAAASIPDALVGTWHGTGAPKNGGPSIDLSVTVNADGSGEYTFDQGRYHESYPFTISNDDSTFSVDISATDMLDRVEGTWALEDGRLILDITTEFASGGSYAYTAECEKVVEAEGVPVWAGVEWRLDTLHFKTLSEDSPYSIDAGMSLNGSATYGSRLRLEGGSVETDIDLNGLIEAVPQLPFSVPELDLTRYDSYTDAGNDLFLNPGEIAFALDDGVGNLSLTYTTHVEVQSQTLGNGLTSQAGETDIEIILGFVQLNAEQTPEPTEEPTPEPTEEPTPEPTEAPTPTPTPTPTPLPEDLAALNALHVQAESGGDPIENAHCDGDVIVAYYINSGESAMPQRLTSDSEDDWDFPREYRAADYASARWAALIFPTYNNVGFYGTYGPANRTNTWLALADLETGELYTEKIASEEPPETISVQSINGIPIRTGASGEYHSEDAFARLTELVEAARPTPTPSLTPEPTATPTPTPKPAGKPKPAGQSESISPAETPRPAGKPKPAGQSESVAPAEAPEPTPEPTEEPAEETAEAESDARVDVEAVLDALGEDVYRTTYEALAAGEVIAKGSKGETARGVQQTLIAFGQGIAADGSVGAKTIAALNAVQAAFGLEQTESLDAEGYAALLPRLLTVLDPDGAEALLRDGMDAGEYDYLRACAYVAQGKYYSARQAFEESGWGDFEARAEACVQPWPRTGELYKNPDVKGSATRLTVQFNSDPGVAMLVKVYTTDDVLARTMFIGGTGKATTSLPAGTYIIKDGTGNTWYGEDEAFGEEGYYEIMTFGGGEQEIELEKNYASTITVNVQESNPDAEGVGSDWESWDEF